MFDPSRLSLRPALLVLLLVVAAAIVFGRAAPSYADTPSICPGGVPILVLSLGCPSSITLGQSFTCTPELGVGPPGLGLFNRGVDLTGAGYVWTSPTYLPGCPCHQPTFTMTPTYFADVPSQFSVNVSLTIYLPGEANGLGHEGQASITVNPP